MCDEIGVFSDKETAKLDKKGQKALRAEARRHLRSPEVQKALHKDPVARIIHPNVKVRRILRAKLRPKYDELKKASQGK